MNRVAIARRKNFAKGLLEQGFRSASAIVRQQSPGMTEISARVTAHRMLTDINTRPEFKEEKAKIAELEELDQIASSFVRDETKPDQTRLKALELSYRRKGALIDRSINENLNQDVTDEAMSQAARRAMEGLVGRSVEDVEEVGARKSL